ncbi:oligosaccharide flippase family protein [Holdemania massiliensis]|uniref:oligosaccharide flippase family protein n=1 Tax=Holdemania massiliensis TaxID=1468449 RepID=UPI00351FE89A
MKSSRTKNTMINIFVIVLMQVLNLIYSLVSKSYFLSEFSISVYGIVDLFSSFFHSLMLLELGFGTILIYNLYKPIALKNNEEIRKQLEIFKTIYFYLIVIIVVVSLLFSPFIYKIFNISYHDAILVYEIYYSNVLHIIIKYWTLNKISILNASQEKYIENISLLIMDSISFVFRMIAIVVFRNIYLYMFSQLLIPSLAYLLEVIWINKHYEVGRIKLISFKFVKESGVLNQCKKYIYATIYSLVFLSMDNIIISAMLSTDSVAYVTNYNALLMTGSQFITTVMVSLRGIMSDYNLKQKSMEGFYDVFSIVASFNFVIVSLMIVGFFVLMDDFISLWLGHEYVISGTILIALLVIRMLENIFEPINSVFIINGYIFKEKWPLIISALTNFILTIILIKYFGLIGAYIATIIALFIKWFGKFYYVLSDIFKEYRIRVLLKYSVYLSLIILEMIFIKQFVNIIVPNVTSLLLFVYKFLIVVIAVLLIDGIIVIQNKSVRTYVRNTLLNSFK